MRWNFQHSYHKDQRWWPVEELVTTGWWICGWKFVPRLLLLEHQLQAPGPILRRKVLLSLSVQCWIACALLTKRARIRKMIQILKMWVMRPRERSRRKGKGKVDLPIPSNHEKERKIPRCSYMHRNPSHYLQHAFTIHISYLSFSLSLPPSLSLSLPPSPPSRVFLNVLVSEAEAKKKELQSLNKIIDGPVPKLHWLGFCLSWVPGQVMHFFTSWDMSLLRLRSLGKKARTVANDLHEFPGNDAGGLWKLPAQNRPKRLSYWFMEISPNEDMKNRIGEQAKWLSSVAVRLGLL